MTRNPFFALFAALILMPHGSLSAQSPGSDSCFIVVGSSTHSFGEIEQSDTVEHEFVFTNNCKDTVEIRSARAGCGCTAVVLSQKVIPPGGEGRIAVRFTPTRGSRGNVSKAVSVFLRDQSEAHTVLHISANVRSDVDIQPSYIQLLNAVVGRKISASSTIKNTSNSAVIIEVGGFSMTSYPDSTGTGTSNAVPLNSITALPRKMELLPGESKDIQIEITPDYVGQINGNIGLKIGSNESVIFVFGVVRAGPGD